MERKFKGIWIPAELWNCKELNIQEKCLIAEIDSFQEFWMSNKAIGEFLGVSKDRAKQIIAKMKDSGIIEVETFRDAETKQIVKRVIAVSNNFKRKIFEASLNENNDYPSRGENSPTPRGEDSPTPRGENYPESNKSFYNKSFREREEGADKPAPPPTKTKRFVKPTLEDVRAYCLERQNNVDPESFVDFYESKGWKVGNQSMKDWKAAVRTWERRDNNRPRYKTRDERLREDDARRERMCKEYDEQHSQSSFEDIKRLLSK